MFWAARLGAGKTLSYVVPSLEKLYRMKWGKDDGVGAIFISPTRELAMQIFQEIVKVGGITHLVWLYLLEGRIWRRRGTQ